MTQLSLGQRVQNVCSEGKLLLQPVVKMWFELNTVAPTLGALGRLVEDYHEFEASLE